MWKVGLWSRGTGMEHEGRSRLYVSWSMKRAVGERASARGKTAINYVSELAR